MLFEFLIIWCCPAFISDLQTLHIPSNLAIMGLLLTDVGFPLGLKYWHSWHFVHLFGVAVLWYLSACPHQQIMTNVRSNEKYAISICAGLYFGVPINGVLQLCNRTEKSKNCKENAVQWRCNQFFEVNYAQGSTISKLQTQLWL